MVVSTPSFFCPAGLVPEYLFMMLLTTVVRLGAGAEGKADFGINDVDVVDVDVVAFFVLFCGAD